LGLALRALGAGEKVFMGQFVKGMYYAEPDALKRFPEIELKQYGLDCFIENQPKEADTRCAKRANEVTSIMLKN
jgi:cob(I)alamin adenosyltransferase